MIIDKWDKRDTWLISHSTFTVEICRYLVPDSDNLGPNRWTVYAYIYPDHPIFTEFKGERFSQPAAVTLPFHGGVSFLNYYYDKYGHATCIQVGGDYNHLYDDRFSYHETREDAYEVFRDGEILANYLDEYNKVPRKNYD